MAKRSEAAAGPAVADRAEPQRELSYVKDGVALARREAVPEIQDGTIGGAVTVVDDDRPLWLREDTYVGLSKLNLTVDQVNALNEAVRDEEVDIKPDSYGSVYMSHGRVRRRLNAAFKPGGWGLRRMSEIMYESASQMMYADYALYVDGHFVDVARGEQYWQGAANDNMTKGDVLEGVKSNALTRLCKTLGIGLECWDRSWTESFRQRCCVKVFTERQSDRKMGTAWRRLEGAGLNGEIGACPDSPNLAKYTPVPLPWWRAKEATKTAAQTAGTGPAAASPATGQVASAPAANGGGTADALISEAQGKRLFAIQKESGIATEAIKEHLKTRYGYTSSTEIKRKHYDAIVAWVKNGGD